jgi:hypothetical protein
MKRNIFVAIAALFSAGLMAASASAQTLVCWELEHGLLGVSSFVYKLSAQDMGSGNFLLAGSTFTTTVTNPPHTVRRVVTGGAVVVDENEIEVSLRSSDISDRPASETVVESLATSDIHFLLDGTLNGTFHIVNVHYPDSSDTQSEPTVSSLEGTVTLVDCE